MSAKVLDIHKVQEIIHGKHPLLHTPSPKCFESMCEGLEIDLMHIQVSYAPEKLFGNQFCGCNFYVVPPTLRLKPGSSYSRAISEMHRYRIWSKSVVSSKFFLWESCSMRVPLFSSMATHGDSCTSGYLLFCCANAAMYEASF